MKYTTMSRTLGSLALLGAMVAPVLAAPPASVGSRFRDQHHRIVQGVRSGELTRGEAVRLRVREDRLHAQAARDRARHDGALTYGEHRRLEREENRTSHAIYHDKHNDRVR